MAAPIISGTDPASPVTFSPGETIPIRILASDPDVASESLTFKVTDSAGNPASVTVTLNVEDDLTYSADPAPTGWTVVQDAADETVFNVTAPV